MSGISDPQLKIGSIQAKLTYRSQETKKKAAKDSGIFLHPSPVFTR
jgi:hypothetical protein